MNGLGYTDRMLTPDEARTLVAAEVAQWPASARRVLLVAPDHTRSCPLGMMYRALYDATEARGTQLDVMIALGTHPALTDEQINERMEITAAERERNFPRTRFYNHEWNNPAALLQTGVLSAPQIRELTGGLFEMEVPIEVNRRVLDYDLLVVLGPVFPHEVVGFSGGNKYFFPGIAGPAILNFFHWLGAMITIPKIIGNKWTPVRRVLDQAAATIPTPRRALCMVVKGHELAGLYTGGMEEAWSAAADLSDRLHIRYFERPFHTVLSCAPKMYDELWVGAKCMYKLEPVVADGGTLIIYAPHIHEISVMHGGVIREVGYHTRDFFLKQWDQYKNYPWGILAHSTHVKGIGAYENGVERPRVNVVLATGISEEECRRINLGWMDCRAITPERYGGREAEGVLWVPHAGEVLHRWKHAPPELGGATTPG